MFFGFLKRLFKKDNKNMDDGKTTASTEIAKVDKAQKRKHKLEIQIFDIDWEDSNKNGGKPTLRPVSRGGALDDGRPIIIEVANEKELNEIRQQYSMCGQAIKVIKEIDPFVDNPQQVQKAPSIPQDNKAIPVQSNSSPAQQAPVQRDPVQRDPVQQVTQPVAYQQAEKPKMKPKIVTIGDIEVKYDGDKVYQKQWMKLTPAEAANFRIVNDSSNKIVNMNGKHIEAKRWTLVEDHADDSTEDAIESILNG